MYQVGINKGILLHVFTKTVQIEETTQKFFPSKFLQNIPTFIFQHDGSPANFHCEVRQYLNTVLPGRWRGRASGNNQPLMLWPPRFPNIRPCDFFLREYVKDRVFLPPLPRDLAELKSRIIAAVKNIDAPMLTRVWQELEYRIDVCRVTRGAHIEHLQLSKIDKKPLSFPVAVNNSINPLKTKRRPLYLKTQSVPRCKHISSRL